MAYATQQSAPQEPRTVVVTGAGRGIGLACVEKLISQGWTVAALVRRIEQVAELSRRFGAAVHPLHADATDSAAVSAAVAEFAAEAGPITACVNAAGLYPLSTLQTATPALYREIFDNNVLGTIIVIQAVLPLMPSSGPSVIVNFASAGAFRPKPDQLLYSAAKAAIVQLTRSLASELAPRGIRVVAVAPSAVGTETLKSVPGRLERAAAQVPLGNRVARPEEIAAMVHWLIAGEGAQYITGETVMATGGLFIR